MNVSLYRQILKPGKMKKVSICLCLLLGISSGIWAQKEIGTSPLEYNTALYYKHHTSPIDIEDQQKDLYPACGTAYYIFDTLELPFIDDFSHEHFTEYNRWYWPASVDSVARVYRLIPDTDAVPLKYSLTPTKHYTFLNVDTNVIDSSVNNIARQLILYGNCTNPFIPVDTITIYAITSPKYYWDTLTLQVKSSVIFPDGVLDGDTLDTIDVYYSDTLNTALWIDNFAYRNISMGVDPPTYGVVTLDGTNEFGKPYAPGGTNSYGVADYFTSKPINLAYPASDNIYISFFHQPMGNGYRPEEKDSLVLEFYSPVTKQWHWAWSTIGDTLTGDTVRPFLQAIVPVTNVKFLQKGFQFRFKNYGNLSGNLDHWNIDYVRLDRNRTATDTILEDVAFVHLPLTILNPYTAMPYHQFQHPLNTKTKWNNDLSNLFTANKTITYGYDFRNETGTLLNQYTTDYTIPVPITNIITPYHPNGYSTYSVWSEPDFNYTFPVTPFTDTTLFTISHYFECTSTDINHENDSITLKQEFNNYYSYDDGTAEQALWLGTPGNMAMKFTNNFADTLRAIQVYFSPSKDVVTSRFIKLRVFSGTLDNMVYEENRQIGVLDLDQSAVTNQVNNGFTTYILHDTVPLPAGDFYIGWYQNQTFKINIGFDKNIDNKSRTYYKTTGVWDTLSVDGTIMIRAVMGKPITKEMIGLEEELSVENITLYPNPANEMIRFSTTDNMEISEYRIFDISGKMMTVNSTINTQQVDISSYAPGIYFIQFFSASSAKPVTKKFIVAR